MPLTPRPLLIAAVMPVLLAGCSSGSSTAASSPPPTASPTMNPLFPVASSYLVSAAGAKAHETLAKALSSIAAMPGVRAASLTSRTTLQVDLFFTVTQAQRDAVLSRLRTLGRVDVPPGQH
jgi:uncharacterized lipoprotein YajG